MPYSLKINRVIFNFVNLLERKMIQEIKIIYDRFDLIVDLCLIGHMTRHGDIVIVRTYEIEKQVRNS